MGSLSDLYFKKETLETLLDVVEKKGEAGVAITISTNDETNQWGQNVSAYVSQTKEEREAQKQRYYVGNGRVFWTDGQCTVAEKQDANQPVAANETQEDGLPF